MGRFNETQPQVSDNLNYLFSFVMFNYIFLKVKTKNLLPTMILQIKSKVNRIFILTEYLSILFLFRFNYIIIQYVF